MLYNIIAFNKALVLILCVTTKQLVVVLYKMVQMLALTVQITLIEGRSVKFVTPGNESVPEPQEIETVTYVKPYTRTKRVKINHYELGMVKA